MPRIRTIKPDAFLSESLSLVPRGTRWTYAGLWTFADDLGRARDDARLIKAALYPLDDDTSLADVRHDLELLAGIEAICRYVVDGRNYLHMPKWGGHQKINRPTPPKSPPCPFHDASSVAHGGLTEPSVSDHGALSEDAGWERKGREGEMDRGREGSAVVANAPTRAELAIVDAELVADSGDLNAGQIIGEWIENCADRPPARVVGQVAKEVKALLSEGIDSDRVRVALAEWNRKGLHPSALASVVHEVGNKQSARPAKQQASDDMLKRAMARAEAREAQMRGESA